LETETIPTGPKINVDVNPESASAFSITSLPSVLVFKDGREVARIVGLQPRSRYELALHHAGLSV